ncbi:hypothetical protein MMC29_004410 [Sticta canariensis]|nr:hypothetical protein [Sticta canariensis]
MDEAAIADVNGYIHGSVVGYYQKYFQRKSWSDAAEQIIHKVNPRLVNDFWIDYPELPSRSNFLEIFWKIQSFLSQGRGRWYADPDLAPGLFGRVITTHLVYALAGDANSKDKYPWDDVQVVGEFFDNVSSIYVEGLSNLLHHARETFTRQPMRLFLHGFNVLGCLMELWMFDRSGVYSCEVFDIRKEPERFITVIIGYSLMGDAELGLMQLVKADEIGKYISLKGDHEATEASLYLEEQPIVVPEGIVGECTTCYRARRVDSNRWDFIVKLKWRLAESRPEEKLLRVLRERNISGVVQFFGQQDLASTKNLRQSLQFGACREFVSGTIQMPNAERWEVSEQGRSDTTGFMKRGIIDRTIETESNSNQDHESIKNRTFSCVVVFPPGRPLLMYKTVVELLEGFRDAMKGHRSLYQDAKILHQDVSIQNIIITEPENGSGPKGMMIDLDSAMELAVGPNRTGELLGTKPFMAIGLLKGKMHTYRHDLESFLYVFLWVAVCNRSPELPETSRLRQWSLGSWWQLAQKKTRDMRKEHFARITAEFAAEFHGLKGLVENLREVLFPVRNGMLWIETDETAEAIDRLYDGMIDAFDTAIASHRHML